MMSVRSLFILILIAASYEAAAQRTVPANDTVMKGTTIEVIQSYKPKVKQAPKPEWIPQLPPVDTTHPTFSYDVPQQTLYYSYSSLPLRPLALGRDTITLPYKNYVKIGGGNLSTIFLDAGIGSLSGPGYETAIRLHHLSQKGDIRYQQTSLSGIDADALLHNDKTEWHFGLTGERDQYYNYGFETGLSADTLKQTYTSVHLSADMKNRPDSNSQLNYHPAVSASYFGARFNTSETTIGFDIPVSYKVDEEIDAVAVLKGAITNYTVNSVSTSNNYVALMPGVNIHKGIVNGHAYLGLASGVSKGIYVLPDILATYSVPGTKFTASAGWLSTLRQNTYEQISTENPYVSNVYNIYAVSNVVQTRRDDLFIQTNGKYGDHFVYSARLGWSTFDALPGYLNDPFILRRFDVIYSRVNAITLQGGARYEVANKWSAGITVDAYKFSDHVWQQPNTKIKGDFMIMPTPKLTVTAYLTMLDGIYAQDLGGNVIKLNTIFDVGGNAEYQFTKRLSAFVQLNNLFNSKYQRWYGYEAYGLNIYGGLRLKF